MIARLTRFLIRREDSLAVQSIILTAARVSGFVLTFSIPIVLVRVFDPTTFGVYKQLFLIAGTALPILNLGMYASIFYFVPRDRGEGHRYIVQAVALLALTGSVGALTLVLGRDMIASTLGGPLLRDTLPLLAVFVLLATPSEMVGSLPVVDRRPYLAACTMAGSDLVRASSLVLVALVTGSLVAVLWVSVAVMALRAVWLATYVWWRKSPNPRRINRADLSTQLQYALPFAAAVIFQTGVERFHEYYVASQVTTAEFAIYAIGILQIPVTGLLVQSVVEVVLVRMAEAHKTSKPSEMCELWYRTLSRLAVMVIPIWMLGELFAGDVVGLLFGMDYLGAVPVFRVFLVSVLLMILVDHAVLRATGDTRFILFANVVGLLVGAAAVVVLTQRSVMLGGITGYVVGLMVTRGVGLARVARRLHVPWYQTVPLWSIVRTVAAAGAGGAAAMAAFLLPHPAMRLAAGGLLFTPVYLAIVLRWEIVPRSEVHAVLRRLIPGYLWGN